MAVMELEARIAALETEMARLKRRLERPARSTKHWVNEVYGAFATDPDFLEAMRLGRQYRDSLRPKSRRKHKPAKRVANR